MRRSKHCPAYSSLFPVMIMDNSSVAGRQNAITARGKTVFNRRGRRAVQWHGLQAAKRFPAEAHTRYIKPHRRRGSAAGMIRDRKKRPRL